MPNRLADQTSPYLLQHAHNPVDWFPWGPQALALAAAEDKPILLSVGYSACHWCHVMERESFEDEATAALMNELFVNIKVDREERPDIDELYMKAVQAFSGGHGGWPMTVFLTPQGAPYFGGTYFPPAPRAGMPSFTQVLHHAAGLYRDQRSKVDARTGELLDYLRDASGLPTPAEALEPGWLAAVTAAADQDFDAREGGFGGRPKFPPHGTLAALLAHAQRTGDRRALQMATVTLDAMARGGMYDLLAGGFCRYSVDEAWRVPHFEKMLYDSGQLVPLYLEAWRMTGQPQFARVAAETLDWAIAEMGLETGGFAASLDADSEGEEGRYYAWTPAQIREVVGVLDGLRVAMLLEVTDAGTFAHGTSVLRLQPPLEGQEDFDRQLLLRALPLLKAARASRVPPGRDDKVLTAWNAMMISALARGASILAEPRYAAAAVAAADFLLTELRPEGRLLRTWKDGRAHILAYADDHALLISALVDLYEATFHMHWLTEALSLADAMLALFWDEEEGGLFYTGADAEPLVTRSKNLIGGAEPAANEVAALALCRLGTLCSRPDLLERAERILCAYQPLLQRAPRALGPSAIAAEWLGGEVQEVAIIGADRQAMLEVLRQHPHPCRVVAALPAGAPVPPELPWLAGRQAIDGQTTAYLCTRFTCKPPVTDPAALAAQLAQRTASPAAQGATRVRAPALPSDPAAWRNLPPGAAPPTLAQLKGSVVVLDFWTSSCINCQHLLPELAAVEAHFSDQPVTIIGVHAAKFPAEKAPDTVERAIAQHRIRHRVILDPEHQLWQAHAVRAWPTVVVLDTAGRVAWKTSGEVDRLTLIARISSLLEEGAGQLAAPAPAAPTPPLAVGRLLYPSKVTCWPGPLIQLAQQVHPFDEHGRVYLADTGNHRILELAVTVEDGWPAARLLRAFGDGQPGRVDGDSPRFHSPRGMARSQSTLWVADTGNHAIRSIDLDSGAVRTVAGTGARGDGRAPASSRATSTALRSPWDVEALTNSRGEPIVFVAMAGAHQIWLLFPGRDQIGPFIGSGTEEHVDGPPERAALAQPSGLVLAGDHLFFVDAETSSVRAYQMDKRMLGTMSGQGLFDFGDVDGQGAMVRMQHPLGITLGEQRLFIADTYNNKIKALAIADGTVTTLAGGDGALCAPGGLDRAGQFLLVADTGSHRLCAVHTGTGVIARVPITW